MNEIKVLHNFLNQDDFIHIQKIIMSDNFPWYFNNSIANNKELVEGYQLDNFYFTHSFYKNNLENSLYFKYMQVFLNKLNIFSLIRCQANMYTRTEKKIFHDWHKDAFDQKELNWTTAVFYLNSNNRKTIIKKDNEEFAINSTENTVLIFPSNTLHRSTTCTDKKTRCVINFNFYGDNK